jgi:hypothetical protein
MYAPHRFALVLCYDAGMAITDTPTVTLVSHGKQLALIIDSELLRDLGIDEKTPLKVLSDGQSLLVVPATNGADEANFQKALNELHERYGRMLKRLAQ